MSKADKDSPLFDVIREYHSKHSIDKNELLAKAIQAMSGDDDIDYHEKVLYQKLFDYLQDPNSVPMLPE